MVTRLSLYFRRYCFLHEFEHYDFSDEPERVATLLTDEENAILMNMVDKCEDLEFASDPNFDACDYAFELERCWKKVDPEVNFIDSIEKKSNLVVNKFEHYFYFLLFFSIITFYELTEIKTIFLNSRITDEGVQKPTK